MPKSTGLTGTAGSTKDDPSDNTLAASSLAASSDAARASICSCVITEPVERLSILALTSSSLRFSAVNEVVIEETDDTKSENTDDTKSENIAISLVPFNRQSLIQCIMIDKEYQMSGHKTNIKYPRIYILKNKKPVRCTDVNLILKHLENYATDILAYTTISEARVSTWFLYIDHQTSNDGGPLLFETLILGGKHTGEIWRYSTYEEAEEGHKRVVKMLMEELN